MSSSDAPTSRFRGREMLKVDCCFFDPNMDAHVRARALLEKDLREAIGGHGIRPHYQPILDLKTRRIVCFESLARWHHPISGLIAPNTFIPLAEELGLMTYCLGNYSAILAEMR